MNPDALQIKDLLANGISGFEEEELKELIASYGQLITLGPDTPFLSLGAYVKTVPIVLSGVVKVVREEAGKEMLLYYINPGESCIMSIHCAIYDAVSQVSAITEEATQALLIPSRLVAEWQNKFPSFNQFIIDLYRLRFENVIEAFNALAFQSLDTRILSHLATKAKALGSTRIPITHQELAEELGAARETVSRILKKLEQDDLVKLHRGSIEVS